MSRPSHRFERRPSFDPVARGSTNPLPCSAPWSSVERQSGAHFDATRPAVAAAAPATTIARRHPFARGVH